MQEVNPLSRNGKRVPFVYPSTFIQIALILSLQFRPSKSALMTDYLRGCCCRLTMRVYRPSCNCALSSEPSQVLDRQDWNCKSSDVQKVGCPFTSFKANKAHRVRKTELFFCTARGGKLNYSHCHFPPLPEYTTTEVTTKVTTVATPTTTVSEETTTSRTTTSEISTTPGIKCTRNVIRTFK